MSHELSHTTRAVDLTTLMIFALFSATALRWADPTRLPSMAIYLMVIPVCVFGTRALYARWPNHATTLLRAGWPFAAGPFTYLAEVTIVQLRPYGGADTLLRWTDVQLGLHDGIPAWDLGTPLEELSSAWYFSYYLIIPLGLLVGLRWGPSALARLSLSLALTSLVCGGIWLLWPAGGYHPAGGPTTVAWGPFTTVMRGIYGSVPHYAAAFPSEHVAHAAAAIAVLRREGTSRWAWSWVALIWASTVYGQYHYAVDGLAGVIVGMACAGLAVSWTGAPPLAPAAASHQRTA